jgi:hypothetical protein
MAATGGHVGGQARLGLAYPEILWESGVSLFIPGLFNDAASSSDYVASNGMMID